MKAALTTDVHQFVSRFNRMVSADDTKARVAACYAIIMSMECAISEPATAIPTQWPARVP